MCSLYVLMAADWNLLDDFKLLSKWSGDDLVKSPLQPPRARARSPAHMKKADSEAYLLIIQTLERQKQEDPKGSLSSQPRPDSKSQDSLRNPVSKNQVDRF